MLQYKITKHKKQNLQITLTFFIKLLNFFLFSITLFSFFNR